MALALLTVLAWPLPYILETSSWRGPTLNSEVMTLWFSSSFTTTSPSLLRVAIPDREPIIFSSLALLRAFPERPLLWFFLLLLLLLLDFLFLLLVFLDFLFLLLLCFLLFFFAGPLLLCLLAAPAF